SMLGCMIVSATLTDAFVCADVFLVKCIRTRAGIRSVRTGSHPWTDTDTEVDRSFKAVRTDVIGSEQQSEPTDVESVFLHVRTEPIGKIVAFLEPNRY